MNRLFVLVAALVALSSAFAAAPVTSSTAAGIEVRNQTTANRFPEGVEFSVFVSSDAAITSARLRARVLPDRPTTTVRGTCTTGTAATCKATLGNSATSYMVPGAEILYVWELEDANGNKLETPEQSATYQDDRFQWQAVTESGITVYYYFGSDETPRNVLRTARETIDRIGALEKTTIDFPLKIWVYQTADAMSQAVASRIGRGPNSSVRTLGEVGAADTALVSRDVDFLNIVRHEVAHIVTGQATKSHINFPSWINEGISVYSQREILPDEKQAMDLAIRRNAVLPLASLGSSAQGSADTVSLFYGQAGSIIKYMVETHGDEKFAAWIAAIRTDTVDGALKTVYGFDLLKLENDWRKSIGLPEVSGNAPSSSSSNPSSIPTLPPLGSNPSSGGSGSQPTPSTGTNVGSATQVSEDDGGSSPVIFIAIAVAVLAVIGGGGFLLMKRKGSTPTA